MSQTTIEDIFLKFTGKKIREAEGAGNPMHAMAMMGRKRMNSISSLYKASGSGRCCAFFRLKSRLIVSVGVPFFFLAFLGMGLGSSTTISGIPQGIGYVSFLTPGIIGMPLLFSATFAGIQGLWDRQFGFLKEIMVAPVSRIAIVLGRTAGGSLVFMILIAATFIGMELAFASQMEGMSGFSLIMNFLIFSLFFLSGALFLLDRFPSAIKILAYLNPLTYGVDGLRYSLVGVGTFSLPMDFMDFVVLAVGCAIMLGLGEYLFDIGERSWPFTAGLAG
jgi:ABC-2 type transport system permease protein